MRHLPRQTLAIAACATITASAAAPHQHGVARIDVALDGSRLTLTVDAPLDGFLGFERAPRSEAERKSAAELLARLKAPQGLFTPDAAAACTLDSAVVKAPVLESGGGKIRAGQGGDHADLEAEYGYTCAQPQALRALDVGLFDAYPRLQRIEVQVAGAKAQSKVTLRRPARLVPLGPAR